MPTMMPPLTLPALVILLPSKAECRDFMGTTVGGRTPRHAVGQITNR
jgi:hypothetical protein